MPIERPVFESLTLVTDSGAEYAMTRSDGHTYSVTANFPAEVNAMITTPAVEGAEEGLIFGWESGAVALDGAAYIPYNGGLAGEYEITFNTFDFSASPFVEITINGNKLSLGDANVYSGVMDLTQGETLKIEGNAAGFSDWWIDPDFFSTVAEGEYTFLPVSGKYTVYLDFTNKYIKVERMNSDGSLGTLQSDGTGAVWLIGDANVGKPDMSNGASWSPEAGGLCLAEVSPKIHQITLSAGVNILASEVNFKFFHQKTWGGEFGGGTLTIEPSEENDASALFITGESDGNIHVADDAALNPGTTYRFTIDLTNATYSGNVMSGGILRIQAVGEVELPAEVYKLNGVEFQMVSSSEYQGAFDLTRGCALNLEGNLNLGSFYFDPDYVTIGSTGATFSSSDGKYRVKLFPTAGYVTFDKLNSEGTDFAQYSDALWLMGWGTAHPVMSSQMGWNPGLAYCLAEVQDNVYQFTGVAVPETDGTTMGGRFRTDYLSFKFFGQNGWGNEMGSVTLTENAQKFLKQNGNIELADDVKLTEGKTYRLTIDMSGAALDGSAYNGAVMDFEQLD